MADGECVLRWLPDPQNPADFLTKWGISVRKLNASVAYASGAAFKQLARGGTYASK